MTQLFTFASDASRVFFCRSKLQRLLSLDPVEVLSLIQHNLYLLSFSVMLRITNLHNYPDSYALLLESGFSSVNSSVVFKHSSAAVAVTLFKRQLPVPLQTVLSSHSCYSHLHTRVCCPMNSSSCRISKYQFTNSSLWRVRTRSPVDILYSVEISALTYPKPNVHF